MDTILYFYKRLMSAKQKGIDVVLIDTAGRMQDNEPLMKALSKVGVVLTICSLANDHSFIHSFTHSICLPARQHSETGFGFICWGSSRWE